MKLRRLAFRGLTRFTGAPVRIDFEALGPGLVALVGQNGAGKSTALEAVCAALYKRLPTRPGSLYDHCHGRDAFVEAEFFGQDGDQIKVRVQVDADRKLTEGYLFLNGEPLTSGKAKDFEAEIVRRFGSQELFLASAFASQNKAGSFLTMDRKGRKELFAQLLGLGRLQELAQRAHDRRQAAETALAVERQSIASAEAEAAALGPAKVALEMAEGEAEGLALVLKDVQEEEAAAVATLERAKSAQERLEALERAREGAAREVEAAEAAIRAAANLGLKAQTEATRRRQALAGQDPDGMEARARRLHQSARERLDAQVASATAVIAEEPAVQAAVAKLEAMKGESAEIQARMGELAGIESLRARLAVELAGAERRLEDAELAVAERVRALQRQAGLMNEAPCTAVDAWWRSERELVAGPGRGRLLGVDLAGACPLLKDARAAKLAITTVKVDPELLVLVEDVRRRSSEADEQWAKVQAEPAELRARIAKRAIESAAWQETAARAVLIAAARRDLVAKKEEHALIDSALASGLAEAEAARAQVVTETERIGEDLAEALFDAQEQVAAAKKRLGEAKARFGTVEAEKAQEAAAPNLALARDVVATVRDRRVGVEAKLRALDERRGQAAATVKRIEAVVAALEPRRKDVAVAEQELGDWALLERALGRDGIQALEIDAAGPQVSQVTNDLLTACYGPRFSIALETLREKKSAPGEYTESFDVRVYDGGQERPVEALSGGERVVVGEALGLALSIYNSRKSGIQYRTLWRDETAGALDPENAHAYVEMLRRAMDLGGFDQVLFVSHSPEVWQGADSRLLVAGGTVVPEAAA